MFNDMINIKEWLTREENELGHPLTTAMEYYEHGLGIEYLIKAHKSSALGSAAL